MIVSHYLPTRAAKQVWDCRAAALVVNVMSVDTDAATVMLFKPGYGPFTDQRKKIVYLQDQQLVLLDPLEPEEMSHAQNARTTQT